MGATVAEWGCLRCGFVWTSESAECDRCGSVRSRVLGLGEVAGWNEVGRNAQVLAGGEQAGLVWRVMQLLGLLVWLTCDGQEIGQFVVRAVEDLRHESPAEGRLLERFALVDPDGGVVLLVDSRDVVGVDGEADGCRVYVRTGE